MRIQIQNFADYNPRTDLKHMHWVRVESLLPTSRKIFGLGPDQKWLWIYLLCLAGEQNKGGIIDADLSYIAHFSGVPEDRCVLALSRFEKEHLIQLDPPVRNPDEVVRDPNEPVRNPDESVRDPNEQERVVDITERNETERRDSPAPRWTPPDLALAEAWSEHARSLIPRMQVKAIAWADAIRRLREIDGLTHDEVRAVFEFVKTDPFWSKNAISPLGLRGRSKTNGLKKIENVMASMRSRGGVGPARPKHLTPLEGEA